MVTQTQIVKVNIGDRVAKKKKRVYKRKPKKPTGTGLAPVLGSAQFGQVPIPAPFARQGWTLEPVIAKQIEAPPMRRIEQQPQMNVVMPPREIRDYMGRLLESQYNGPRIEEMPPSPPPSPKGRAEKPPSPLVPSQQPPPLVLPPAVPVEEKRDDLPPMIIEKENPRRILTPAELQELRDEGQLTAPFLRQFVKVQVKAKAGEMSLEKIARSFGIDLPQKIRDGSKENLISFILEKA
jgi:hypothetical protein